MSRIILTQLDSINAILNTRLSNNSIAASSVRAANDLVDTSNEANHRRIENKRTNTNSAVFVILLEYRKKTIASETRNILKTLLVCFQIMGKSKRRGRRSGGGGEVGKDQRRRRKDLFRSWKRLTTTTCLSIQVTVNCPSTRHWFPQNSPPPSLHVFLSLPHKSIFTQTDSTTSI